MLRTLRARVGILSLSRPPLRVHSELRKNDYPIERVRFKRPRLRPKVIIGNILLTGFCWMIFDAFVLVPLDKVADELEVDDEVEEDSIFIPFPGTTKLVQPVPYRGTDPEWQEYIKFSKDPALGKRIRDDLANFIRATVEKSPTVTLRCGKGLKLRRYWLDVDFPMHPPPEFRRSGIEITDNATSWKSRPVDSLTVFRIRQALWPSAMTQSLWSFSKALIVQDTASIAGMLGLQTKPQPSFEQILAKHTQRTADLNKTNPLSKDAQTPSAATTGTVGEQKHTDPNSAGAKYSYNRPDAVATTAPDKSAQEVETNAMKMHLTRALMAFKIKLQQTWKPAPSYPPRGAILVSGLVELDSPKAWLVVDVKAAWDPQTKEYDPRSMQLVLRRLQMKRQAPYNGS